MQNIKELRDSLLSNYRKLQNEEISVATSKELSNISGKVFASVSKEIEYNKMLGYSKKIKFMDGIKAIITLFKYRFFK